MASPCQRRNDKEQIVYLLFRFKKKCPHFKVSRWQHLFMPHATNKDIGHSARKIDTGNTHRNVCFLIWRLWVRRQTSWLWAEYVFLLQTPWPEIYLLFIMLKVDVILIRLLVKFWQWWRFHDVGRLLVIYDLQNSLVILRQYGVGEVMWYQLHIYTQMALYSTRKSYI